MSAPAVTDSSAGKHRLRLIPIRMSLKYLLICCLCYSRFQTSNGYSVGEEAFNSTVFQAESYWWKVRYSKRSPSNECPDNVQKVVGENLKYSSCKFEANAGLYMIVASCENTSNGARTIANYFSDADCTKSTGKQYITEYTNCFNIELDETYECYYGVAPWSNDPEGYMQLNYYDWIDGTCSEVTSYSLDVDGICNDFGYIYDCEAGVKTSYSDSGCAQKVGTENLIFDACGSISMIASKCN